VEVEDVVQEAYLCAFRDIRSCSAQSDRAFAAWLGAIGRHQLTNAVKAARAKKRGGGRVRAHRSWAHSSSLENLVHQLSDRGERPSQAASRQQAAAALRVGLASLPADQRCAMELRYLDGITENEIAAKMGRTRDAVHGLVKRARSTMRDLLGHSSRWFYRK
jgi:RNA polymerase sigma-70 factor (ECF subfamily)